MLNYISSWFSAPPGTDNDNSNPNPNPTPPNNNTPTTSTTPSNSASTEVLLCKVEDLQNGQAKEFEVPGGRILLVKEDNQFHAVSNKCTHYGAPLKTGHYENGRVRCPWHGACFSTVTGDIEDFPALDSLQVFKTRVEGGEVYGTVPTPFPNYKRTKGMCSRDASDSRVFVIIGGGPAGHTCAETLRQEGFTGRVVLFSKEAILPYDRTKLSKALSVKTDSILLRPEAFFKEHNIEIKLGVGVVSLHPGQKTLKLSDGSDFSYDKAFLATGGRARRLQVPGHDLKGIHVLREPQDANDINAEFEGKDVVIVGSSFIGLETAAIISKKAKSVQVIGMEKIAFERVLGPQVGATLQNLHEKNGIKFVMERVVQEFLGKDGRAVGVRLDNGTTVEGDTFIVGAGIVPNTEIIDKSLLPESTFCRDGSLFANKFLEVEGTTDLYVGGDIARYPYFLTGELIRVEHYGIAQYHGFAAAKNMLGKQVEVKSVPFFWTSQYGKTVRYAGHATSYNRVIVDQSATDPLVFAAYYYRDQQLLAVAAMGRDPLASEWAERFNNQKDLPTPDQLADRLNLVL